MNNRRASLLVLGLAVTLSFTMARGQATGGQSTVAPPAAATPPPPRHVAIVPNGFHLVTIGERSVFCEPADDDWVKQTLSSIKPVTRPSTMPSDVIDSIQKNGAEIIREVQADFAATDPKPISDLLNTTLVPQLKQLQTLKPAIFYMPTTRQKLINLMDAGWTDPRYHYNRFNKDVEYDSGVKISLDAPMDDQVILIPVEEAPATAAKHDALAKTITDFDFRYASAQMQLSELETRNALLGFLQTSYMDPLKLPISEQWFGRSIAQVYSLKYTALLIGAARDSMTQSLLGGNPKNPLKPEAIDLMNPMNVTVLRPEFVPAYDDAATQKGVRVVVSWIRQAGDGGLAKILPSLRYAPITSPADLVKRIKDATGADLTKDMSPNP